MRDRNVMEQHEHVVKDIMHRGVITCKTEALLKEVVRIISDTGVHALVVIEENGDVAGVISHMDLLRLYGQNLLQFRAKDVMGTAAIDVHPDTSLREAVELMLEHRIQRLLVTEETPGGKRAIGILSTTDIIREMREQPWFW